MGSRVLSPLLIGRQEELSRLEDALLSANRGDGRFLLLAGEAGIGKTRLATAVAESAQKLGCTTLWGRCSDAELSLPYLPFVEAIGNELGERDLDALRTDLGPLAVELAQLFPQLVGVVLAGGRGDAEQAKLRLFESVVALLELWAHDRGLLLVLDDVHWADGSTRELLDYLARRLASSRVLLLATYRSDELDRLHPLTRMVRVWRGSGIAETVSVEAMSPDLIRELIAAILDADEVSPELAEVAHARSEGNPFVLEEMLKDAVDRRELVRTAAGWEHGSTGTLRLPETVRDAVLLRLGRLDPREIEVLRAAAVLGRSFDYALLVEVAEEDEPTVLAALESAIAQQLVEENADASEAYSWRHALTQEAIASDTVVPKRQRIHSRAADALGRRGGSAMVVARHLIGAGRADEAVEACLRAADDAERAVAFTEAVDLLERVLPHVADPREQALLLSRMGGLRWANGEPAAAEQLLDDAVARLDELGLDVDAAHARIHLGRTRWELDRPDAAMQAFERAREALEGAGPSAELALAYVRIAGIHAFELESELCAAAAERAIEIAEQAGADFERVWALSFLALGKAASADSFALFDQSIEEALEKGYGRIASGVFHNEIWTRVHSLAGDLRRPLEKGDRIPSSPWISTGGSIARSWAELALGRPREALEQARDALAHFDSFGATKFVWRSRLAAAEALLELGRAEEAADELPPPSPGAELQDIVYDTPARLGIALALGRLDEAEELVDRAASADRILSFAETSAVAVEGLVAVGRLDEASAVLARAREAGTDVSTAGFELAEGRILLASGRPAEARPLLERAADAFERVELRLWAWRAQALAAEAAAQAGDPEAATALFGVCIRAAHEAGAVRIRTAAQAAAERLGLDVPLPAEEPDRVAEPRVLASGERLVTSMFADVRGYTAMTAVGAPAETADRITTLHRWAAAEVGRRHGIVDKFAGDAVMATFNVLGARVDHAVLALEAALALRDKAALLDLPVGIGIAVGPAVVTRSADASVSVLGAATNLAARLQTAAAGGEILLSDDAYRRVAAWLDERGLAATREELALKGFDGMQPAFRLAALTG
jgi:class 3 adenylate cyclase